MKTIAVTRIHLRSFRFFLPFMLTGAACSRQAKHSDGCHSMQIKRTKGLTFWTLSSWTNEAAMFAYRDASPHKEAIPKLAEWSDEASVVHWQQESPVIPDWQSIVSHMRSQGRPLRVKQPSERHAKGEVGLE